MRVHHLSEVLKLLGITVLLMTPLVGANADPHNSKKMVPIITLLLEEDTAVYRLLNDTGIVFRRDSGDENNTDCSSDITVPQDCNQGRDVTHPSDSDGHAGFSYTKVDASGNALAASASSWSCVKDNVTGLVWEVKQNKDGDADADNIHDADNSYRWGGIGHLGTGYGPYHNDWDTLVDGSNDESFCGFSNWRVPTINELENLVNFNENLENLDDPDRRTIDTGYFPSTISSIYWSASPNAQYQSNAWAVHFNNGITHRSGRSSLTVTKHVRLVRSRE